MNYEETTDGYKWKATINNGQLNVEAKTEKDEDGNVTVKLPKLKLINDLKEKEAKDKLNSQKGGK